MSTDTKKQADSTIRIGLKNDRAMTVIPKPVKKSFRRLEIAMGVISIAVGLWLLLQFGLWISGADPLQQINSRGEAILLLVQSVYLTGFSVNLLRTGYVALVFWMIAIAILISLMLPAGLFN